MNIDYYCFVMDSYGQKDYSELKAKMDAHIFENLDFDIDVAKRLGKFTVYCKETGKFYDSNWNELSLANKVVLTRCIIPDVEILYDALENEGANLVCSRENHKNILNWGDYIKPKHREMISTTYSEFLENFNEYQEKFGRVFFKTKKKHISCEVKGVINLSEMSFNSIDSDEDLSDESKDESPESILSRPVYMVFTNISKFENDFRFNFLKDDTVVYVEPFMEITKDEEYSHIPVEYRSFVVDGKFVTSRSWIPNRSVPEEVITITQEVVDKLPEELGKTCVVDVLQFVDKDGNYHYDLCEINPLSPSGYEEGSTIFVQEDLPESIKYYSPNSKSEDMSM